MGQKQYGYHRFSRPCVCFSACGGARVWLRARRRAAKLAYDPDPHYTGPAASVVPRGSLRLSVRTSDFQSEKTGSTPVGSAMILLENLNQQSSFRKPLWRPIPKNVRILFLRPYASFALDKATAL